MEDVITTISQIVFVGSLMLLGIWVLSDLSYLGKYAKVYRIPIYGMIFVIGVVCFLKCSFTSGAGLFVDSIEHNNESVLIAGDLRNNILVGLERHGGLGNQGFRLVFGVIIAVFDPPDSFLRIIPALLIAQGSIALLKCMLGRCRLGRVEVICISMLCLFPSTLFWGSEHLKEGYCYWGSCHCACIATIRGQALHSIQKISFVNILAMVVLCYFRPHHAICWFAGIAIQEAIIKRSVVYALFFLLVSIAGIAGLSTLRPELVEKLVSEGSVDALEEHYDQRREIGGSAIDHGSLGPIPVVTGAVLLLSRPWPWEARGLEALLCSVEILIVAAICIWAFAAMSFRGDVSRYLKQPGVAACLVALVCFSALFSYYYNMGLLVRHRIVIVPIVFVLCWTALGHSVSRRISKRTESLELASGRLRVQKRIYGERRWA